MEKIKNGDIKVGDKLRARWTDTFDRVTKDNIYEVKEVIEGNFNQNFFKIENDNGEVSLPISVRFERIN